MFYVYTAPHVETPQGHRKSTYLEEVGPTEAVSLQGEDPETHNICFQKPIFLGFFILQHFLFFTASPVFTGGLEYPSLVLFHFHHFTAMAPRPPRWTLGPCI